MGLTDMQIKLEFVTPETLPSGNVRYRFRRGGKKVTLKGEPGSPEFMRHYAELKDGIAAEIATGGASVIPGSVAWLVGLYLADLEGRVGSGLSSPLTLKGHRHHLGKLVDRAARKDANMPRKALVQMQDEMVATPGAARNFLKAVSALYRWAIDREYVAGPNPTRDIKRMKAAGDGFVPWAADDFRKYLERHQPGTMARRALILAMSTTARRGDLVHLGRQHEVMKDGRKWLRWKQSKAPRRMVEMPMSSLLISELTGHGNLTYITNAYGAPFSVAGFGERFKKWCEEAGVQKRLHGVRKGISSLLPSMGANSLELDVLLGHELNSDETKVYVENANRDALAVSVIDRLDKIAWQ